MTETESRPSRRVVTHAAAWTIPVIAVSVAAPLATASVVIVPGEPATYPDATFSATQQAVSNPSLKSNTSNGYARTTFTALTDDQDYSSYKTAWTYVVSSAKPVTNITFDTTTLTQATTGFGAVVNGLYTYTWFLVGPTVSTWVRVKPTAFPQSISFVLNDTTHNAIVGEATATTQA